jgi:hypothetical protein
MQSVDLPLSKLAVQLQLDWKEPCAKYAVFILSHGIMICWSSYYSSIYHHDCQIFNPVIIEHL